MDNVIEVKNLIVSIDEKIILNDISFSMKFGETIAIMGPNGSGKSTLSNVLMGNPIYKIESGYIFFNGVDITNKKPEERASMGMFMVFQNPREIDGVEFNSFLFDSYKAININNEEDNNVFAFRSKLDLAQTNLNVSSDWGSRYLNVGFSGGEKKKAEMLQIAVLKPSFVIFDEIDSGLDIDSLKIVGESMTNFKNNKNSAIIVTHYERVLKYLPPDRVVVLKNGRIVLEGGSDLVKKIEENGFENVINSF